MAKILMVEDDLELCNSVGSWLKMEHHTVEIVNSGLDAQEMLLNHHFDIIILDWELPELNGVELCKKFRSKGGETPVLMLTGRSNINDKSQGFDAGADDYLTKPFILTELTLRIRALLRRAGPQVRMVLKAGDLELEPDTFQVKKNGEALKLLPKEFALLEFLMRHPEQVFSLDSLLARIWVSDSDASTDAVQACIKRLRRKIDTPGAESMIANVHGVGYRLNPNIKE